MQKKMDAKEEKAWQIYCQETAGDMDVKDNWFELSDKVRLKYLDKAQKWRMDNSSREHAAWEIWMKDHPSDVTTQSWWDLSEEVRKDYLSMVDDQDKITQAELQDWFGESMPMQVFQYIFKEAKAETTTAEVKAHVRQMAMDFRSSPALCDQAMNLMQQVKKNGNIAPAILKDIGAWESRYFINKRERSQ